MKKYEYQTYFREEEVIIEAQREGAYLGSDQGVYAEKSGWRTALWRRWYGNLPIGIEDSDAREISTRIAMQA